MNLGEKLGLEKLLLTDLDRGEQTPSAPDGRLRIEACTAQLFKARVVALRHHVIPVARKPLSFFKVPRVID